MNRIFEYEGSVTLNESEGYEILDLVDEPPFEIQRPPVVEALQPGRLTQTPSLARVLLEEFDFSRVPPVTHEINDPEHDIFSLGFLRIEVSRLWLPDADPELQIGRKLAERKRRLIEEGR